MTLSLRLGLAIVLVTGVVAIVAAERGRSTSVAPPTVVVAELFTSEGCSSCPPADDLLRGLAASQPVDGVELVVLGNHVDYWDRLGWRDPFSSPVFSQRQSSYDAAVFRSNTIYTPQLVVDGTLQCVGSDATAVRRTVLEAAKQPKAAVTLSADVASGGSSAGARVRVQFDIPDAVRVSHAADIMVAVTESGLVSRVERGENRGRTMHHSAVVRSLTVAGTTDGRQRTAFAETVVPLAPEWKTADIRVVSFLQERDSRRILGGAAAPLTLPAGQR
jgi:hypothetical protein